MHRAGMVHLSKRNPEGQMEHNMLGGGGGGGGATWHLSGTKWNRDTGQNDIL